MRKNPASFRDPSGFIFEHNDHVYRTVHREYGKDFERLIESGLADKLFRQGLMVQHEEVDLPELRQPDWYTILKPEKLPLISYPYEWSFSQLKEASLLTLDILQLSLEHGMILKDASAFNVQFKAYHPVFIDTLSFVIYEEGQAWNGYRQFCEHFLAPLCLGSSRGVEFLSLVKLGIEGIPLKLASKLLPGLSWLNPVPLMHIHLHSRTIDFYSAKAKHDVNPSKKISKRNLMAMADHLRNFIDGLKLRKSDKTQWQNYNQEKHYSEAGKASKALIVRSFADRVNAAVIWDIGANDGFFSRAISHPGRLVLSLDFDPLAVESNFQQVKAAKDENVFPLLFDIVNPSPGMGWANQERQELIMRAKPGLVLVLALIHHIVITHNVPFMKSAEYFASLADWLIIEFVPRDDEKIDSLPDTAGKKSYGRKGFETAFYVVFECVEEKRIEGSQRSLLLLKRK